MRPCCRFRLGLTGRTIPRPQSELLACEQVLVAQPQPSPDHRQDSPPRRTAKELLCILSRLTQPGEKIPRLAQPGTEATFNFCYLQLLLLFFSLEGGKERPISHFFGTGPVRRASGYRPRTTPKANALGPQSRGWIFGYSRGYSIF